MYQQFCAVVDYLQIFFWKQAKTFQVCFLSDGEFGFSILLQMLNPQFGIYCIKKFGFKQVLLRLILSDLFWIMSH